MQKSGTGNPDTYCSIAAPAEGLFKDRGSRFVAYAVPVRSEAEVKAAVEALKKEHHGARHHCYAYRLGCDGSVFRANDDGEPSGSAGRQILGTIDSAGLSDTLVVVVRYFGGILLGVPGLIRAYRESAAQALCAADKIERTATAPFELLFPYENMNDALRMVRKLGLTPAGQECDTECRLRLDVPLSRRDELIETIKNTNDEKGTRLQCRPLQIAPGGD